MIKNFKAVIAKDLHRYGVEVNSFMSIYRQILFASTPGVRFMITFRLLQYFKGKSRVKAGLFYLVFKRLKVKYGFDISHHAFIGPGLYLGHFGGVVIHGDVTIGSDCNISQGVTIGVSNHGKKRGSPSIGNNVFIGPGAVIVGAIKVGNNVTIGANTLVNFNVPDFSTVITTPSLVIQKDLSEYYIHNRNCDESLC